MYRLTRLYNDTVQSVTKKVDSAVQYTKSRAIQTLASLNLIEGADVSSPTALDPSTVDPSTVDPSTVDPAQQIPVLDPSGNPVPSESSFSSIGFIIVRYLWTIIALVMAVFVANDLIFMPWQIRLLGFFLVFFNLNINPFVFFGVIGYYIVRAINSVYFNYTLKSRKGVTPQQILAEQKFVLPAIYGFLPLVTWKEGSSGINLFLEYLLFPIKYSPLGELAVNNKTSKNYYYKRDKAAFEAHLKKVVPEFDKLLENPLYNIKDLIDIYTKYSNNLNYVAPLIAAVSKGVSTATANNPTAPPAAPLTAPPAGNVTLTQPPAPTEGAVAKPPASPKDATTQPSVNKVTNTKNSPATTAPQPTASVSPNKTDSKQTASATTVSTNASKQTPSASTVSTNASKQTPSATTKSKLPPPPASPPPAQNSNAQAARESEQAWRDNPASGYRFQ